MKCGICELSISKTDRTEKHGDGFAHKICFDISCANLEEELRSFMRANPQEYRELPDGKFTDAKTAA